MFRAAALAIVMTLTAGPLVGLVCKAVCSNPVADAPACHRTQSTSTTSVTAVHDCSALAHLVPGVLREDNSRGGVSHCLAAAMVPATTGDAPAVGCLVREIGGDSHPPPRRPITLVIRI